MSSLTTFLNSSGFQRYLKNTFWMFLTYGLRLFSGFFVGLWLARYLGPRDYGIYNYVISFSSIFLTITAFGTPEIIVKKILEDESYSGLKAGFDLRLFLSLILYIFAGIYAFTFESDEEIRKFILISSMAIFFQPFEVVDSFFRARVQVRKSSIGRMAQLFISAIFKILLILYKAPFIWFYFVFVFDSIFYAAMVFGAYLKDHTSFILQQISWSAIRSLAKESFPLMVTAVSTLMLSRFDLVLIGKILNKEAVGYYSAASKTIEIGALFATIISLSIFPAILNAKKVNPELYLKRMAMLNRLLISGGVILFIFVFYFSDEMILSLFGDKFFESSEILKVLSLNLIFVSFQQVSFRWYLSEKLQDLMMYKTVSAVLFSIVLNLFLIPRYGILGAAYSSIVTSLLFHFLFELFFKRTRECFKINISFLNIKN